MTALAHFKSKNGRLSINGQDVTDQVTSCTIMMNAEQTPLLTVTMRGEGTIEGDGIVEVVDEDVDIAPVVVEWLKSLDPESIEAAIMEDMGWGEQAAPFSKKVVDLLIKNLEAGDGGD